MSQSQTLPTLGAVSLPAGLVDRCGAWLTRHRALVCGLVVAVTALTGVGILSIGFTSDYRVFFDRADPRRVAYEQFQQVYASADNVLLVVRPDNRNVFTPQNLAAIRELTEAAWKIPYSRRVNSLSNFQHSFADGDDLTVRDLLPWDRPSAEQADSVRRIALAEPLLRGRLVSADASTTAVNISLALPRAHEGEVQEVVSHVRALTAEFSRRHPDIRVAVTGIVPLNHAYLEATLRDLGTLLPLMALVVVAVLLACLRSLGAAGGVLLTVLFSTVTAMGIAGWLGVSLTPASAAAPVIVMIMAVADSVHLIVSAGRAVLAGRPRAAAIGESLRGNLSAITLTSLTSAIGYLSLNFSDSPPLRDLGTMAAIGVGVAWVYTLAFLPAYLAATRFVPRTAAGAPAWAGRLTHVLAARYRPILLGMAVLVAALAAGVPRIELNDEFVRQFDPSIRFRADTELAMRHLPVIYNMEFSLQTGEQGGVQSPAFLHKVADFTAWLKRQPGVSHVASIAPVLRRLNMNLHGDDPAYYRLPEARTEAAQYLLLYEMSLPRGLDLNDRIDVAKSATRVTASLRNISTREAQRLQAAAERWLAENLPGGSPHAVGALVMFAHMSETNIRAMLLGTGFAFVLVALCLCVALRSVSYGLLSLIPNIVPAVMAFGLWGLLVGEVGIAASVIAAMTFGIIVDNTIYLLSRYRRARREAGEAPVDALQSAFTHVGSALWISSAVLFAGFAVLSLSSFQINQQLGLLTCITIAMAFVADFLLLPAILLTLGRRTTPS